jgi:antitoxin (DNA-binding transcriptional repressor) of toxin-antitoxin stability system
LTPLSRILCFMDKPVIHISASDAASDFPALLERVRAGAEVIIESKSEPVAILHSVEPPVRTISESIARAKAYQEETGEAPVLDADFAEDVEKVIAERKPWNPPPWD